MKGPEGVKNEIRFSPNKWVEIKSFTQKIVKTKGEKIQRPGVKQHPASWQKSG
jgi:hypothetical protein